jgi:ABC-type transport system involved in cytochrome bd biosynthesis fused ATPase/permease subunit
LLLLSSTTVQTPIVIKDGWFAWDSGVPVLRDIDLTVNRGEFVAIVGATGSGKSSLVSAILNEVTRTQGTAATIGSVAYVPQQAWVRSRPWPQLGGGCVSPTPAHCSWCVQIYNATVRENILFGLDFNEDEYWEVRSCVGESLAVDVVSSFTTPEAHRSRIVVVVVAADCGLHVLDDGLPAVRRG